MTFNQPLEQSCTKSLPYSTEQFGFVSKLFLFILLLTETLSCLYCWEQKMIKGLDGIYL